MELRTIDRDTTSDVGAVDGGPVSNSDAGRPICVDLDGTLISTDVLVEGILAILSTGIGISHLPKLLVASRAELKRRVGELSNLNVELLPFNSELIDYLRLERQSGRRIVLATAADRRVAEAVAAHLGLFDEVIGSDAGRNLKGRAKADELVRRFGRKGFDYVGNDRADLAVWREAEGIVLVNAPSAVAREARTLGNVVAEFASRPSTFSSAWRAMRPYQWVKNLLVFVPLLASRSFGDVPGLAGALLVFASFCATASAIYIVNDLLDLAADRSHPRKRSRPFASGALQIPCGACLAGVLGAAGIALAAAASAVPVLLAYAVASLGYSLAFKRYPLLDVFILAALYTLRIVAGGVASQHHVTLWLLAFSGFTFLSLALVKRAGEIARQKPAAVGHSATRRGYLPEDRVVLLMFGIASAFASSVVLALFISTAAALQEYRNPGLLWIMVPLVLFWQCRLWLSTERGNMHDDPIVYAARDWVSWIVGLAVIAVVLLASWAPPLR